MTPTTQHHGTSFTEGIANVDREMLEKHIRDTAVSRGLEYVDVSHFPINPDLVSTVSEEEGRKTLTVPFLGSGKKFKLAVLDDKNSETINLLLSLKEKGYKVEISLASKDGIIEAWDRLSKMVAAPTKETGVSEALKGLKVENLDQMQEMIKNTTSKNELNIILAGAVGLKSSDVHFEPYKKGVRIRFRIDGVLVVVMELPQEDYHEVLNQIKFASKIKLNVLNLPQDGRMAFTGGEKNVDIRVSTMPTKYGDTTVLRLLDKEKVALDFEVLGFSDEQRKILEVAISRPNGMILTTGPTSSGKTTTLYTILNYLNKPEIKIITLEDPIEYELEGIIQSQVTSAEEEEGEHARRQYTFSRGLRAILRQNPDIIMLGEIRDRETAEIAAESALTGHLLLSTLHTNDAVSTVTRFLDMGIEPFLIAPSLDLIMAQRLIRKLCPNCKKKHVITPEEKTRILKVVPEKDIPSETYDAEGCEKCNKTGYKGQLGIYEMLLVDNDIRSLVLDRKPNAEILKLAREKGMKTMIEDGLQKAIAGITSLEEVWRVASE